ncbi:PLP-dependent transferase [candidate division KSB1 bacterium]|nr:MAG: PLP-dependent transferase [candidate division KSB1 bacterium]
MNFNTACIHAGVEPEPVTGAIMTPIFQTSTYVQPELGVHKGYEYTRTNNPTRAVLQNALAALEGARFGLCFATGMAATDALVSSLKAGDHMLCCDDVYGGTYRLLKNVRAQHGIQSCFVDFSDLALVEKSIRPETRWIWIESPTNPTLKVIDIRAVVEIGHKRGIRVAVDNTFMTPYFQRPFELGADLVMHSCTKYLNGHSDVVMGCLITNHEDLYEQLKFIQNAAGGVPSPFDCFLVLRGLKTLAVRMQRHQENAFDVANFLIARKEVRRVSYPGLRSHPQYELAKRQASGFGGMVSFELAGGLEAARAFAGALKVFALAESLGGVESLCDHPAIMTHASVPRELREKLGITDGLIRLSVGIESADDLTADLAQALDSIR